MNRYQEDKPLRNTTRRQTFLLSFPPPSSPLLHLFFPFFSSPSSYPSSPLIPLLPSLLPLPLLLPLSYSRQRVPFHSPLICFFISLEGSSQFWNRSTEVREQLYTARERHTHKDRQTETESTHIQYQSNVWTHFGKICKCVMYKKQYWDT